MFASWPAFRSSWKWESLKQLASSFEAFLFALSFSPQTINAGQDTLHNESLKSNSVIVPHKLITSAFLRPNCLNIVFGIKAKQHILELQ